MRVIHLLTHSMSIRWFWLRNTEFIYLFLLLFTYSRRNTEFKKWVIKRNKLLLNMQLCGAKSFDWKGALDLDVDDRI